MTADPRRQAAPGARPIVDLSGDAVLERAEELAKRWAIALILARPLDAAGGIPLEELAREAPALCAQAIRAVQSDVELERLTGRGASSAREDSAPARGLAAISGARDPAELAEAVEALRGVLWEALRDQFREPISDRSSARLLADVCDRVAYVCAGALAAAADAAFASPGPVPVEERQPAMAVGEPIVGGLLAASAPAGGAVIIDERVAVQMVSSEAPAVRADVRVAAGVPAPAAAWPEIAIRDERGEEGPAAWIGSIGARLEHFARDGRPFAVLLVEFVDMERLSRQELAEDLSLLAGRVEQALAPALSGWAGTLTRERPGRCWLLAPETDRAGARRLAEHLAYVVASGVSHRGAPLEVAIGTAVCPEDGREAAALAAHADVGLYAARSAARGSVGRRIAPTDEPG